jgi:hypothetical protein
VLVTTKRTDSNEPVHFFYTLCLLFVQQLFYRSILASFPLFVEDYYEGNGCELELLLQIAPFGTSDVDVLAFDVVGFQE